MLRSKRTSKKVARKNFTETKLAKGIGRLGREITYVGLGVTAGAVTTAATAVTAGAIAGTGQVIVDKAKGGATATVREKGFFKKEKEVKLSEMKNLKKYKSVQMHGLHDAKNKEIFGKATAVGSLGVGLVTGATAYSTLRGIESGIKAVNQMSQVYYDMPDEELYEDVPGEEA